MSLLQQFQSKPKGVQAGELADLAKERYLNYAHSVIVSRALPDVRDGLKPVQRRILYAMNEDLKLYHDRKHRKSATIVGATMGKYHAHGDSALYGAMVRMAQDWVLRVPLVDGYGNFGNIDGDPPAAHRYTEARLKKAGQDLMQEIGRDAVDFRPNFDSTAEEPTVLPAKIPLLLINGCEGIAVGLATKIPPHNPTEVLNATIDLVRHPARRASTLLKHHLKGPDFPTGGSIVESTEELETLYDTGSGSVTIRAKWSEEKEGRNRFLVIEEIPYGVSKQDLVVKIASHIADGSLPQVEDIRDESTDEVRIVLELDRKCDINNVMAYLFKHTDLELKFHVNMTVLVPEDGGLMPRKLGLVDILQQFIDFRLQVIERRSLYDLKKIEERLDVLAGFLTVMARAEEAVEAVVKAGSKAEARENLVSLFQISEPQADQVLNAKVYRFASYELKALQDEADEKEAEAARLRKLLQDEEAMRQLLIDELKACKKEYASDRQTLIEQDLPDFEYDEAAFIEEVPAKIIVSRKGWVRRQKAYSDLSSLRVRTGDEIGWALAGNTVDTVTFFTDLGRAYTARVVDLPDTSGYGDPIQGMFSFSDGENILAVFLNTPEMLPEGCELVAVSDAGQGVRFDPSRLSEPSNASGRMYMRLDDGVRVVGVERVLDAEEDFVVVISRNSRVLSFGSKYISQVKGAAKGVKCLTLEADDSILAFGITSEGSRGDSLTVVTTRGSEKSFRHTTLGTSGRGGIGELTLTRDNYVSWVKQAVEHEGS